MLPLSLMYEYSLYFYKTQQDPWCITMSVFENV